MGNDGGTIVRRADLVRVKNDGKGGVDPSNLAKVLATTCLLSHKPLSVPVVSDSLGRLYNKDALVTYLLQRSEKSKMKEASVAGHLRGLKDVRELKLTPNTAFKAGGSSTEEDLPAPFVCPLNQREMNGKHRFVYLTTCGCVMSESGLRAVVAEQTKEKEATSAGCPVCGTIFSTGSLAKKSITPGGDVILINGSDAEVEEMLRSLEQRREVEAARKKELKAKDTSEDSEEKRQRKEEKRKRKEEVMKMLELEEKRAKRENGVQAMPTKAGLVAAEAKNQTITGKEMSPAMRSIYGLDKPKQVGSTWMTMGTFNRFA